MIFKRMKTAALVFLCLTFRLQAWATSYDNLAWFNLTLQGPISKDPNIGAYLELQPRYSDNQKKTYETLLRPAFFYKTNDYGSYFLGYLTRLNGENREVEKRYWAQWLKSQSHNQFKFTGRARYEWRDLNLSKASQRLRLLLRLQNEELKLFDFKPFIFSELFYNMNGVSSSIQPGMRQTRTGIGMSRLLSDSFTLEFAIMKNLINPPNTEDVDNNVLQITFIADF